MGGEPWLIRKPFIENPSRVLQRYKQEILSATTDWPEIIVTDGQPVKLPGVPQPTKACTVSPLPSEALIKFFKTEKPESDLSEDDIEDALMDYWDHIPRGEGNFFILYKDDYPREVCFFGYSFD